MKIVILDGSAANPGDLSWNELKRFGEVAIYDVTKQEELIDRVYDADICLTNKTRFTAEDFERLPNLKYIGVVATGYNVVDIDAAREHGIVVTNVPEYATFATAQMAIALLLEITNKVGIHSKSVFDGVWTKSTQFCYTLSPLFELQGKTVAVIGMGKIGKRFALIARTLGLNVIGVLHGNEDTSITIEGSEFVCKPLESAVKEADIISFHCPLTKETTGLISNEFLTLCKDGVIIINTARGLIVDESAVVDGVLSGKIGGFACDVVSEEPMLTDNPLLQLKDRPNCVITPHIAWEPIETRSRLIDAVVSNVEAFIRGEVINRVN